VIQKWMILLVMFVLCEIVIAFLFSMIAQIFYKKVGLDFKSIIKGVVERLFLVLALYNGYHHGLTFFSAVKVATRLKHGESEADMESRFNDYYLMGNLVSVSCAIGYVLALQHADNIMFLNVLGG